MTLQSIVQGTWLDGMQAENQAFHAKIGFIRVVSTEEASIDSKIRVEGGDCAEKKSAKDGNQITE